VSNALFNEDFLRRLEHLNLVTRRPVAGHLRGSHRSRRTGSGMVFSDYRPYTPGDDTRNLDWGIYLRLDRLILTFFRQRNVVPSCEAVLGVPFGLTVAQQDDEALFVALDFVAG
jgi:uncharacterized protein (DUF58 family)